MRKFPILSQRVLFVLCLFCLSTLTLTGQGGYFFGIKGGLTVSQQNWNNFERDPLLSLHGDIYTESLPAEGLFSLFASFGYHPKGSALRNRRFLNVVNNQFSRAPAQEFIFQNLSLVLGAKQRFDLGVSSKLYYSFGIRGDYTIDTNLDEYSEYNNSFLTPGIFPIDDPMFINEINYGVSLGGGIEFMFSEFVGGFIEFNIHPDFSKQYVQGAIPNVLNPFNGQTTTIPQREIRNLAFELSVGLRLLRKIEYID